jgi:hypothetical protein
MFRDPCALVRGRQLRAVSSGLAPNVISPHSIAHRLRLKSCSTLPGLSFCDRSGLSGLSRLPLLRPLPVDARLASSYHVTLLQEGTFVAAAIVDQQPSSPAAAWSGHQAPLCTNPQSSSWRALPPFTHLSPLPRSGTLPRSGIQPFDVNDLAQG